MAQEMMRAAVLSGPRRIELKDVPVPPVTPGTLKIRVSTCGVCGSDIHMWQAGRGWSPTPLEDFHMGHESAASWWTAATRTSVSANA